MRATSGLAPRFVRNIRDEILFLESATNSLSRDSSVPADAREKIAMIGGYLHNAAQLARQFLIISSAETRRSTLDIGEALSQLKSSLKRLLGDDCQLRLNIESNLRKVFAEPGQLEDIVLPMLVNAHDAMPHGGTVWLAAKNVSQDLSCSAKAKNERTDWVALEIKDSGSGIPKHHIGRIFDPFFSTKGRGCGFGLAKVWATVQNLGGRDSG